MRRDKQSHRKRIKKALSKHNIMLTQHDNKLTKDTVTHGNTQFSVSNYDSAAAKLIEFEKPNFSDFGPDIIIKS